MIGPSFGLFLFVESLRLSSLAEEAEPTRIYGGEIAKTCEFPTTIAGRDACTGTLVHPRVILSAAHCGKHREFLIGETKRKPAKRIKAKWCETGPVDAQICVLAEPLEGLPFAPIPQGCEVDAVKKGSKVIIAGYGYDENDPVGDGSVRNEKRWVETEIFRVTDSEVHLGGQGKTACNGDSGGPAFVQLDDGTWRTVGATYAALTGGAHPNCKTASYKRTDKLLGWYRKQLNKHGESDINLTPCFDDSGNWKPTKACGGYTKDVRGPHGAWDNNCGQGVPTVKYSATCGEPFAPNDEPGGGEIEIELVGPQSPTQLAQDEELDLKGKVGAPDAIKRVSLVVDDKKQQAKSEPPFVWTIEGDDLGPGTHEVYLEAQSKQGESVKSRVLEIEVVLGESSSAESPGDIETDPPESKKDSPGGSDSAGSSENKKSNVQDSGALQDGQKAGSGGGCRLGDSQAGWLVALCFLLLLRREGSCSGGGSWFSQE